MTSFNQVNPTRRKLILHRVTRAISEKLQREDIMALYSFMYMDTAIHREYIKMCSPEEAQKSYIINNNMLAALLAKVQEKRGFDWAAAVQEILQEEGVTEPDLTDTGAVALAFMQECLA